MHCDSFKYSASDSARRAFADHRSCGARRERAVPIKILRHAYDDVSRWQGTDRESVPPVAWQGGFRHSQHAADGVAGLGYRCAAGLVVKLGLGVMTEGNPRG